jgi:hypothetical protein
MERREFLLSAGGIVGATAIGSVAYTEATVTRNVNAKIANDDSAIIGLVAGSHQAIYNNGNDRLEIDTTNGAAGLNSNGTFTYGNATYPVTDYGFSVTNNDNQSHDLTVKLKNMSLPDTSTFQIEFFDGSGTSQGTVTSSSNFSYSGWASGETIYAVVTITTDGTSDTDSIGGDLVFVAN